jgi:hypothetical protein
MPFDATPLDRRVTALAEVVDVTAHRSQVLGQMLLARSRVMVVAPAFERGQRDLGVDQHVAPAGEAHDHIRAAGFAAFVAQYHLRVVVATFAQARDFEQTRQHQFAPGALGLRVAGQRARQVDGVAAEALVHLPQIQDLGAQHCAALALLRARLDDQLLELLQLLAQRRHQAHRSVPLLAALKRSAFCSSTAAANAWNCCASCSRAVSTQRSFSAWADRGLVHSRRQCRTRLRGGLSDRAAS